MNFEAKQPTPLFSSASSYTALYVELNLTGSVISRD